MKVNLTVTGAVVWVMWFLYFACAEFYMLGAGGTPLTTVVRTVRFDVLGRFIIVPLLTWLYWHIVLRPAGMAAMSRWDFVPIALGLALAGVMLRWYPLGGIVG